MMEVRDLRIFLTNFVIRNNNKLEDVAVGKLSCLENSRSFNGRRGSIPLSSARNLNKVLTNTM